MRDDPAPDLWLTCSNCHNVMVPLADYEIKASAEPGVDADPIQFFLFGWWGLILSYFFGKAEVADEKAILARAKKEVLPEYPKSQVCPKCFMVSKRK